MNVQKEKQYITEMNYNKNWLKFLSKKRILFNKNSLKTAKSTKLLKRKTWHICIEIHFIGNSKKELCLRYCKRNCIFWYHDFLARWKKLHHEKRRLRYCISQITICLFEPWYWSRLQTQVPFDHWFVSRIENC